MKAAEGRGDVPVFVGVFWSETTSGYKANVHTQNSRRCGEVRVPLVKQRSVPAVRSVIKELLHSLELARKVAMATAATATRRGIQGPRRLCREKLALLGECWGCHSRLSPSTFIPLQGAEEGGGSVPGWWQHRDGDRSSHLCLAAMGAVELVPALAQPGQAGLVLLAQRLQLPAQLRALRAQHGALSRRGPLGSVHTQRGRAAAVAAALHLHPGTAQLCCLSILVYLQGQSRAQRYCSVLLGQCHPPAAACLCCHSHITGERSNSDSCDCRSVQVRKMWNADPCQGLPCNLKFCISLILTATPDSPFNPLRDGTHGAGALVVLHNPRTQGWPLFLTTQTE